MGRTRSSYSIRTQLAAIAVVAVLVNGLAAYRRTTAEPRALAKLRDRGADFKSWRQPDSTYPILMAWLHGKSITDDELSYLEAFPRLESLSLDDSLITDAGLIHIKGLANLKTLFLRNTQITDDGLSHLSGLSKLEYLDLRNTRVSDAGLARLRMLHRLRVLFLNDTLITDAGLMHLTAFPNLQELYLNGTQVTDAGLPHLEKLTRLETIQVTGPSKISRAGFDRLQDLARGQRRRPGGEVHPLGDGRGGGR